MTLGKKYIHLLFIVGFFFHSSSIMCAQSFGYDIIPNVSMPDVKDVTEINRDVSTIFRDNSAYIIAPTAVLLGGAAFLKRKSIQNFCKAKYKSLTKDIMNTKIQLDNRIDHTVPVIVQNSAKKIFTWALGPITTTAQDYWKYNELHVYAATFCGFIGWISSHAIIGGGLGGIALALGYLNQGYKMLEELKTQAQENFESLQTDIKNLSKKIDGVKQSLEKTIETAVDNLQNSIEIKVETVGVGIHSKIDQSNQKFEIQLSGLSKELQALTDVCVSLTGKFDKLHKDNAMRDEKSDLLFKQLEKASIDLLSAKESFSLLSNTLVNQMTIFTENTEKQLNDFTNNATERLVSMESKVEMQAKNTAEIKDEVSQLLGKVFESHDLVATLQSTQIESTRKIINLSELVKEVSLKNSLQCQLIEKVTNQQDQSGIQFTKSMSLLEKAQNKLQTTFDGFFDKFEKMELEIVQLKKKHKKAKKERQELKQMFLLFRAESAEGISSLRQCLSDKIDKSMQQSNENFQKFTEEIMQHQEKTIQEAASRFVPATSVAPQIEMSHSFVPYQLPFAEDISKKSKNYMSWNSQPQSFVNPQMTVGAIGILGVALKMQSGNAVLSKIDGQASCLK